MVSLPSARSCFALLILSLLTGCAFHRTATVWNGHNGADGQPVFVQTSTYWGCHACIALPMAGKTTIDRMVDAATARISTLDGSHLRVIETESNNYWWSVPPLTWLVTPVLTSVSIEYRPSERALAAAARAAGEPWPPAASPGR